MGHDFSADYRRLDFLEEKMAALIASLQAIEPPGDLPTKDLTYTQTLTHGLLLGQHHLAKSLLEFLTTGEGDANGR
jgi:hypothetical protein